MKKVKVMQVAATVLTLSLSMAFSCQAGEWKKEGDRWWYAFDESKYAANGIHKIDKVDYFFDPSGDMRTGWIQAGAWYYADESGALAKGWRLIDNKWYYFDTDHHMQTGWLEVKNKVYYLKDDGSMQTGSFEADGVWYTANSETGAIIRNRKETIESTGKMMRYNSDGSIDTWNETTKDWEPVMDSETYKLSMISLLQEEYYEGKYATEIQFENVARTQLKGYMNEDELDQFLRDTFIYFAPSWQE